MTIIHVSAYFAPAYGFGGPPRSLVALCQAQAAAGLDVEVFTTTANPGGELAPAPDGVTVEGVRVRRFPLAAPRWMFGAPSMAPPLARAARSADVVHLHGLFNRAIWIARRAVAGSGRPYVVSPRGMLEPSALAHHRWRKRAAWWLRDRRVLRGAAAWHATSEAEAATLGALPDPRPVLMIPNSLSHVPATGADRADARRAAGLGPGAPFLLFLGRLHPIKRLDLLAAAFARVAARHPDATLVIAGPDEGGYRARVEPAFAPVAARVRWTGAVDGPRKAGLLAEARALVLCSDSESFGMSVAEALAAATPAIVTRTCPWRVLEASGAGYWVPQSADALAGAMDAVLADPAAAGAMGARGRALAVLEYGPEAVGRRWAEAYRGLAGRA
ncbi:MAG: glycosyltransferase [Vicinamibacterales bacterium]